jgi:hypothetical protein|tara:strand:- start:333 stop:491 length:159 start_codon:yes stop_codon:yes gene_type:complete
METKTPRSYHARVQAARKAMWMRENERLANPPKEIDWTATIEAGKVVYKKTK